MAGSPYTLDAARQILLGKRSTVLKVLDRLLGVGILAAGPFGIATGNPWLLAAWGWVDQKNELMARLDELVDGGRAKLRKAAGHPRHEILAATHAALTIASFFAALREVVGPAYDELGLTDEDIARLTGSPDAGRFLHGTVQMLLHTEFGLPWAGAGLEGHIEENVRRDYRVLAGGCMSVFAGFEAWRRRFGGETGPRPLTDAIVERAVARYRDEYLRLAADVPEFRIWALFGEHRAEQDALRRLEDLAGLLVGNARAQAAAARGAVAALNRAVFTRPIVDLDEAAGITAIQVPSVERGYIEPDFRWAVMKASSRPEQEQWWDERPRGTDLAGFIAAHLASPSAAERPLVVLGHPGSGKSLFTKVCAARLSAAEALTTVRVPLRDVPDPSASVYRQIEDVLRESTHGRVEWRTLCEAGRNLVRVVLIDGLDELMQATGATESRYLRNVTDFQQTEAATSGPVAVIVTSRTLVADLAAIPQGCTVVRLEPFTDGHIDAWAARWADSNAAGIARGAVRAVDAATLRDYGDLARQPLLLLLLAIVAAERDLPAGQTSAELYRTLLDDFIRRELARPDRGTSGQSDEQRRDAELWTLGLVAFGMLNRGQQHLHEEALADDLRALPGPAAAPAGRAGDVARSLDPARRVVGRFFFVHTSEADAGRQGRSYEFLHATFADYLVAHHTVALLRDAAEARNRRTASQAWDDDLLFALLSHTLIGGLGSRTMDFFAELARGDEGVAAMLEHLAGTAQDRWGRGRHGDYDPSGTTVVQRLAAYTANLVALRLAMADSAVEVARLCPSGVDVRESWWAQVHLWEAVLSPRPQWGQFIASIGVDGTGLTRQLGNGWFEDMVETVAMNEARAMQFAAGRTLLWGPRLNDYIDQPGPRLARDLTSLLMNRFATEEELAVLAGDIPEVLQRLAVMAGAVHAPELSAATAVGLIGDPDQATVDVAEATARLLVARQADLTLIEGPLSAEAELIYELAALINRGSRASATGRLDTPEVRALLTMPVDLARRVIPEVVAALLARERRETTPE